MSKFWKIFIVNVVILLVYSLIVHATQSGSERGLGVLILSAFLIGLQVLINFIVALVCFSDGDKASGKLYLLNTGLMLLIGFSTCLGNAAI